MLYVVMLYTRGRQTAGRGPQVPHFRIVGSPLSFDKDQHFAIFLCCAVRNWDYNRLPIIGT